MNIRLSILVILLLSSTMLVYVPTTSSQTAAVAFSVEVEDSYLELDARPYSTVDEACTNVTVSNQGTLNIDVDIQLSGGGVTVSPSSYSVTLSASADAITTVCVTHNYQSLYYSNPAVSIVAQGRESNTQTFTVTKYAGFDVNILQFSQFIIRSDTPYQEVCPSTDLTFNFTMFNYGITVDSFQIDSYSDIENYSSNSLDYNDIQNSSIYTLGSHSFSINIQTPEFNASRNAYRYIDVDVIGTFENHSTLLHNVRSYLYLSSCDSENIQFLIDSLPSRHPVASANHWNDVNEAKTGQNIDFKGTGTDEDGTIIKYEWDFNGDGSYEYSSSTTGNTSYAYNVEGTYTAVLRVTDNDGFTDTDSRTITVTKASGDGGDGGDDDGFIPAPSIIAALGVLLVVARRKG